MDADTLLLSVLVGQLEVLRRSLRDFKKETNVRLLNLEKKTSALPAVALLLLCLFMGGCMGQDRQQIIARLDAATEQLEQQKQINEMRMTAAHARGDVGAIAATEAQRLVLEKQEQELNELRAAAEKSSIDWASLILTGAVAYFSGGIIPPGVVAGALNRKKSNA